MLWGQCSRKTKDVKVWNGVSDVDLMSAILWAILSAALQEWRLVMRCVSRMLQE